MSGEVIRDTQVGTEGDDVPDHLNEGRQPQEYEGAGTHRFETRMSDEEISKGISRDARRAAELMKKQMEHDKTAAPVSQQTSEQAQQQVPVRAAGADVTDQPSS
ncbi:hypothetical protein CHLRE_07g324700v5 [Chlamydomonas reinhardtii]|uniref:Uncharacterized protein n=1 Tax=Chlamydomonas reinhardtii TaxID=3055 RepID=A8I7K0_CHLRE|nr:uncharacterized protein CHLRE_07g324700v5 [Chlamydomonas reinhardtii]PNW80610.1 hypothetical protein CHLRE_07g324700v5 [Chlamydomonas reinhardtii]|eukprot:XP_001700886.1 predicted protein [Chlamydomonas reinhardtii]